MFGSWLNRVETTWQHGSAVYWCSSEKPSAHRQTLHGYVSWLYAIRSVIVQLLTCYQLMIWLTLLVSSVCSSLCDSSWYVHRNYCDCCYSYMCVLIIMMSLWQPCSGILHSENDKHIRDVGLEVVKRSAGIGTLSHSLPSFLPLSSFLYLASLWFPFPIPGISSPDLARKSGGALWVLPVVWQSPAGERLMVQSELNITLPVLVYSHALWFIFAPWRTGMMFLRKKWRYGFELSK